MNKHLKTYLLLAVVLGIWGTIAYRIISGLNPDLPTIAPVEMNSEFVPRTDLSKEVFTITPVERDPFLGTLYKKAQKRVSVAKHHSQQLVFPPISYQGMVKKQKAKNRVFIINVNQKQHLFKVGQTIDSITLVSGNSREVRLRYRHQSKVFKQDN